MRDTLFKTFFDSAPDAVIIADDQGKIILSNHQASKLFGYDQLEFSKMQVEDLMPEQIRTKHMQNRARYGENPKAREMGDGFELVARRKDGSEFFAEISLSPVHLGDSLYVSAAIRDVTEKKELLTQMKNQQILLSSHNSRLLDFAHIVSHNLRSHAGNLGMMLDFFQKSETEEEKNEIFKHLQAISRGLSDTVNHLKEIITLDHSASQKIKILSLRDYVERTHHILTAELQATGGQLINNVPEEIKIPYNSAYLESILLNLISNSIKYRHPERSPIIVVNASENDKDIVLQISDNGLGIDLKRHGKDIFGLYKVFHNNKDAHGVGLFITRNQIESLGGSIHVQSDVGKGTTFKIFIKNTHAEVPS